MNVEVSVVFLMYTAQLNTSQIPLLDKVYKVRFGQFFIFVLDVDECKRKRNVCHVNATCNNTEGSYNCSCKDGFTGDGKTCQG